MGPTSGSRPSLHNYTGTAGADTITPAKVSAGVLADPPGSRPSDAAADVINGLAGNDNLDGAGGGNVIIGGAGNDGVRASGGGNTLHGNAGNDALFVEIPGGLREGGNDVTNRLFGDDGNDHLNVRYGPPSYDGDEGDQPSGTLFLYGGAGQDVLAVDAPYVYSGDIYLKTVPTYMYGGAGDDTIQGIKYDSDSDGTYQGGKADFLYGGSGDDTYRLFGSATVVETANDGDDTVVARDIDFTLPANVENLVLEASGYYYWEVLRGTGNDQANTITGTFYADELEGRGGGDRLFGGDADDRIYGGAGNDSLAGQAGDDTLWGGAGDDHLGGGSGGDVLYGEAGVDALTGRDGADTLTGGAGDDRFVYETIVHSKPGAHDTITDMAGIGGAGGDRIDLHKIDADVTKGGNQDFTFVGSAAALKAGQVHVVAGGGSDSLVHGEVDGKAGIDFEILVEDGAAKPGEWIAGDFIL